MSGKIDQLKGWIKETAGARTGDESLKQEGQRDLMVGKVKETTALMVKKVKKTVEKAEDTMKAAERKLRCFLGVGRWFIATLSIPSFSRSCR